MLWFALIVAVIAGLIMPFVGRFSATSLWAGKALVPPEAALGLPRGLQEALIDGWPSTLGLISSSLPVVAIVIGFFHAWWTALAAMLLALSVSAIAERTSIAPLCLERYLALLLGHAQRRWADYSQQGDAQRTEAAQILTAKLEELLRLYVGTGIPAPSMAQAKAAPFGDQQFFLRQGHVG